MISPSSQFYLIQLRHHLTLALPTYTIVLGLPMIHERVRIWRAWLQLRSKAENPTCMCHGVQVGNEFICGVRSADIRQVVKMPVIFATDPCFIPSVSCHLVLRATSKRSTYCPRATYCVQAPARPVRPHLARCHRLPSPPRQTGISRDRIGTPAAATSATSCRCERQRAAQCCQSVSFQAASGWLSRYGTSSTDCTYGKLVGRAVYVDDVILAYRIAHPPCG